MATVKEATHFQAEILRGDYPPYFTGDVAVFPIKRKDELTKDRPGGPIARVLAEAVWENGTDSPFPRRGTRRNPLR